MRLRFAVALWALLPLCMTVGSSVHAQTDALAPQELSRATHSLASDLMSPYCPGRTLADCPSPDAGALREEIRAQLASGKTPEQVRAEVERRFGSTVQGVPLTLLGWVLPGVGLLVGIWLLRRAWRKVGPA